MDLLYHTHRVVLNKIYILTFHDDPSTIEYSDLIATLNSIPTIGPITHEALTLSLKIRNRWAHEKEIPVSEIMCTIGVLRAWLASLLPEGQLGQPEIDPLLLLLDVWMLGAGNRIQIVDPFPAPLTPIIHRAPTIRVVPLSLPTEAPEFVNRGILRDIKLDPLLREQIKGRRIVVLDGIHQGRIGTFKRWSGTVADVNLDYLPDQVVNLSNNREVGVLRI